LGETRPLRDEPCEQLDELRAEALHGARPRCTFDQAAAHYLLTYQAKVTIKTVNLGRGIVRRILNLSAMSWRDEHDNTWWAHAPAITMPPLVGHQREPQPITWGQQRELLPRLPEHLARMALFALNTGVRDDVVCNGVAQAVIEAQRGKHEEFVFVWRRERVKNIDQPAVMPYRPLAMMNNTAWQQARREIGLPDLHVHDLRHTVGMRLREAGVPESTVADILWHSNP
jgi:integrase